MKTYYLWDGDNLFAELRGTDGGTKAEYSYYPGLDNPHAVIVDGVKYYAHRDGLGTVVALTDEGQALKRTYDFNAWGGGTGRGSRGHCGSTWDWRARRAASTTCGIGGMSRGRGGS